MKYIEDQYFQYRADQATQVLNKSRKTIKAAKDHLDKAYTFLIDIYTPPSSICMYRYLLLMEAHLMTFDHGALTRYT